MQVFVDSVDELGPAARRVEVLDPQLEPVAARGPEHRAKRMPQMKPPGRRRRETSHDHR